MLPRRTVRAAYALTQSGGGPNRPCRLLATPAPTPLQSYELAARLSKAPTAAPPQAVLLSGEKNDAHEVVDAIDDVNDKAVGGGGGGRGGSGRARPPQTVRVSGEENNAYEVLDVFDDNNDGNIGEGGGGREGGGPARPTQGVHVIFGEEMIGENLGRTEIRKAQQEDDLEQMMVERCSRAGASKDKRASKFMIIDGALYRVTGSGDPQEGRESQRIYVPLELRAALMRNYHSTVWSKHQHSRSMHKQMVAWYYWNTMEKGIQEYVSTCELC